MPESRVTRLFALPVFVFLYLAVTVLWRPPAAFAVIYFAASLAAFLAYAFDKSAAKGGRWRTSEGTLHLLALAGGWPGALLAQQFLRHKSAKASFNAGDLEKANGQLAEVRAAGLLPAWERR